MKTQIQRLLATALAHSAWAIPAAVLAHPPVERGRDPEHGDFSTPLALSLAKTLRRKPRELAEILVAALPPSPLVAQVDIAGPGFINFHLSNAAYQSVLPQILQQGAQYGRSELGAGQRVQVEFVSANPTGPLHVGHGRGAAYGASVADLLEAIGFSVEREYYVNDGGRQMDILATSVWLRYLELCGETLVFPSNGYQGDYVWDIAATLHRTQGNAYRQSSSILFADLPPDAPEGDKETYIDALIERTKCRLGAVHYRTLFDLGLNVLVKDIRDDLEQFGVRYDNWYSERSLTERGAVDQCIERLQTAGHLYEQAGALWFRSTAFGDEKDRVVRRENGQITYFASDIAYHLDKLARGFDRIIDIWGADHHGYVPRVTAALRAAGADPERLAVRLVQFAILYRGRVKAQMSTRSGDFVTLRELRQEVGRDAARFFYVMRKCEQHLDFDLDLATSQSADNPVYYIQYAHARIHSVLRQAQEKGLTSTPTPGGKNLERLVESHERTLLRELSRYPEVVEMAALSYEPHQLTYYLRELANGFHAYYNAHPFLVTDADLRDARLKLVLATGVVLHNGLHLLGVSAPERM